MMKNKLIILFGLIVLFSCKIDKKEKLNTQDKLTSSLEEKDSKLGNVNSIPIYDTISNPDTALAYFLYYTNDEFLPKERQIEYQRLDLEYENQIALIKSIFSDKSDIEKALNNITTNRKRFIDFIRESVKNDYEKYHGVSGMSFDYLLERNDSIVKPLLYELIKDEDAPISEKKYAAKILSEKFNDKTYIDKF